MDIKDGYTFVKFYEDLSNGFQIYYTYMEKRYILTKLQKNCYSNELVTIKEKSPHPKTQIITLKKVMELFPFMEEIEYRVDLNSNK